MTTETNTEALRGPWRAVLSWGGDVLEDGDLGALDDDEEVDIDIRRGSALPDAEGRLPGTYRTGDQIELWRDLYVGERKDSDGADACWARAKAMAAGLNAAAGEVAT